MAAKSTRTRRRKQRPYGSRMQISRRERSIAIRRSNWVRRITANSSVIGKQVIKGRLRSAWRRPPLRMCPRSPDLRQSTELASPGVSGLPTSNEQSPGEIFIDQNRESDRRSPADSGSDRSASLQLVGQRQSWDSSAYVLPVCPALLHHGRARVSATPARNNEPSRVRYDFGMSGVRSP
jgi:hypothetical protein